MASLLLMQACSRNIMEIHIEKELEIAGLPSGSGIVRHGDHYFVIGDDSPFLFTLNEEFQVLDRRLLLDNPPSEDRISKAEKPDFEALELVHDRELILFGSGSKSPQRDVFFRMLLEDTVQIERFDLTDFYRNIKELPVMQGSELNIEAAAFDQDRLFLFNRKKNVIFQFDYPQLLSYLRGESGFATPKIYTYTLPSIKGIEAGFSGAAILPKASKIIFTASVEATDNAYDDGEILGSMVGLIDLSEEDISSTYDYCLIPNNREKLKVESVTIAQENSDRSAVLVLIADNDKGNSTLVNGKLFW
jgi:hypothetical protein